VEGRKAGLGGGEGFLFFAKGEADLGGAVAGIVVKAGAGDHGYANVLDKVLGKSDVVCVGSGAWQTGRFETGDIGHDVVRATGLEDREADRGQNLEKAFALG